MKAGAIWILSTNSGGAWRWEMTRTDRYRLTQTDSAQAVSRLLTNTQQDNSNEEAVIVDEVGDTYVGCHPALRRRRVRRWKSLAYSGRSTPKRCRDQISDIPTICPSWPNVKRGTCAVRLWLALGLKFLVNLPGDHEWRSRRLTVAYQAATFLQHDHVESAARRNFLGHGGAAPPSAANRHIHGLEICHVPSFRSPR